MNIELQIIDVGQKPLLAALMDDYLLEHYAHKEVPNGPRSTEDYQYFEDYWQEEGRFPYFILKDSKIIGFVLVRTVFQGENFFYQVSEYYILPNERNTGAGLEAIRKLWSLYPGQWELEVLGNNTSAVSFWTKCAERFSSNGPSIEKIAAEDGVRLQYLFQIEEGV